MSVLSRLIRVLKAYQLSGLRSERLTEARLEDLLREFEMHYNRAREKVYQAYQAQQKARQGQYKRYSDDEQFYQHNWRESYQNQSYGSSSHYSSASSIDPKIAGYYANLEIPYGSDLETVRQAWRKLVAKYHPDKFAGQPEKQHIATELTKGINRAYEELTKYLSKK
ncbi:MAG: DnaJ family molecular chaperone [Candidatus Thermochlorobacter sp.]